MDKYIKMQDIIDRIYPVDPENDGSDGCTIVVQNLRLTSDEIEALVDEIPAADVVPVVHAKWEECDYVEPCVHGFGTIRYPNAGLKCTNCVNVFNKKLLWKDSFCPNCGAKMDGGQP